MSSAHDQIIKLSELQAKIVLGLIAMGYDLYEALDIVLCYLPSEKKGTTP